MFSNISNVLFMGQEEWTWQWLTSLPLFYFTSDHHDYFPLTQDRKKLIWYIQAIVYLKSQHFWSHRVALPFDKTCCSSQFQSIMLNTIHFCIISNVIGPTSVCWVWVEFLWPSLAFLRRIACISGLWRKDSVLCCIFNARIFVIITEPL